ncbi:MAG: hypothetical protein IT472_06800 [Thermomonas sp.]|uniref:hypothetical protein n=1 Tax=Thermomonas sp. TaxID=1971895 RepID=UPI002620580B|nr:hypothetical protein [Thermomonas sp.]MCC7096868.1 hypothetical protein [Thermomonas sp.]
MPKLRVAATMLLLAGCTAANPPAPTAAPKAASAATPAAASPSAAFGAGTCLPLAQWQAEGKRGFVVASAGTSPEQGEADAQPFTVNFKVTLDGKASTGQLALPEVDPAAIVFDDQELQQNAQVCNGHVFIANLAEERGGTLVIGNLQDGALAMTSLAYASGDEDSAELSVKDGAVVVTDRNGSVRLQESSATDPATPAHGLVAESAQCEQDAPQGHTWLRLALDTDGGVRSMEYTATMSGGASCTVSAGLAGDKASLSQGKNVTDIRWDDNEDPSQASHMRVSRNGDVYTLEPLRYDHPQFCGQSAQLANVIKLHRNSPSCASVEWPK